MNRFSDRGSIPLSSIAETLDFTGFLEYGLGTFSQEFLKNVPKRAATAQKTMIHLQTI